MNALDLAALLRDVTGCEEQWIAAERQASIPAACHVLLARCLAGPGQPFAQPLSSVRGLSLAERDWLLVELRCRTFGARAASEATCFSCGHTSVVEFDLRDLAIRPTPLADQIPVVLHSGRCIALRGLTAADHEQCAAGAGLDRAAQVKLLLSRTLVAIDGQPPAADSEPLSADDLATIEKSLEAASPEPVQLDLNCRQCGQPLRGPLDLCSFVLAELRQHSQTLLDDVHTLARTYHWSEAEILALPLRRRLAYLTRIEADHDAALFGISKEFVA